MLYKILADLAAILLMYVAISRLIQTLTMCNSMCILISSRLIVALFWPRALIYSMYVYYCAISFVAVEVC